MAEILIERKEGRNWVPLMLAVVLAAALVWWFAVRPRSASAAARGPDSATVVRGDGADRGTAQVRTNVQWTVA